MHKDYHRIRVHLKPDQYEQLEELRREYERDHVANVPPGAFASKLLAWAIQRKAEGGQGG